MPKQGARFVAKMEDVLSVYKRAYDPKRPMVCIDEIQKALRSTPKGEIPLKSGHPIREDYEYQRHGKCSLFLAVEPLAGFRKTWIYPQRRRIEFAQVLKSLVDEVYPKAEKIVLVLDNLNIHHITSLYEKYPPQEARRIADKLEWHYTPEHGSWLNIAECELSVLRRQALKRRRVDINEVCQQVNAWEEQRNERQVGIDWRFTCHDARIKLKRLYPIVKVQ